MKFGRPREFDHRRVETIFYWQLLAPSFLSTLYPYFILAFLWSLLHLSFFMFHVVIFWLEWSSLRWLPFLMGYIHSLAVLKEPRFWGNIIPGMPFSWAKLAFQLISNSTAVCFYPEWRSKNVALFFISVSEG